MYGVQDFVEYVWKVCVWKVCVCGIVNVMFLCVFEKVSVGEASTLSMVHV